MTHKYKVELTDTFGGEPNYGWVRRATIELPEDHSATALVRAAKKAIGLNGVRCRMTDYSDMLEMRPYEVAMVCFVTYDYDDKPPEPLGAAPVGFLDDDYYKE